MILVLPLFKSFIFLVPKHISRAEIPKEKTSYLPYMKGSEGIVPFLKALYISGVK
jgi:hypothetical protein